jgi:hypothetical protein
LFLDEWLATIPSEQILKLDVSNETLGYERSLSVILDRIQYLLSPLSSAI